jgi:fumarate reductase subunit D
MAHTVFPWDIKWAASALPTPLLAPVITIIFFSIAILPHGLNEYVLHCSQVLPMKNNYLGKELLLNRVIKI